MTQHPFPDFLEAYSVEDIFDAVLGAVSKEAAQHQNWVLGCGWGTFIQKAAETLASKTPAHLHYMEHFRFHRPEALGRTDYVKLAQAAWLFVHRGLAYPVLHEGVRGNRIYSLDFTEKGFERIRSWTPDQDGAHREGYLRRLQVSQPLIDAEVFARLQDAEACLAADLFRPAIVMIGIATEVTLKAGYETMKKLGLCKGTARQFKDILADVHAQHEGLLPNQARETRSENIHRIKMALAFIETIRDQRNRAAHPGNASPDGAIVRAQFTQACLHLPVIWDLVIIPELPPT